MAKRNKSALKANRQNIKRREHNRALRSKLRTGLKAIRKSLDAKNVDGAKAALLDKRIGSIEVGKEADGYQNTGLSGRVRVALAENVSAEVRSVYSRGKNDFDGFAGDSPEFGRTEELVIYTGLNFGQLMTDHANQVQMNQLLLTAHLLQLALSAKHGQLMVALILLVKELQDFRS